MKSAWPSKRLGELAELITKGTTPTSVGFSFVPEGINFVKVESISGDGSFIEDKLAKITRPCHEALKRSQLKSGDILFSIAGALGRTACVTEEILPANTNQALALIRLRKSDDLYIGYVLKALSTGNVLEQIEKSKGGVAQLNLSLAQIQDFTIPVPPLAEQKRIVAILDQAFDAIATAKANAEKNLQNARALFDSHLQATFSQRGDGWVEHPLVSLCALFVDSAHRTPVYQDAGIPALRPRDVVNGKLNLEAALRVSDEEYEIQSKRHKPSVGDIVYSRELSYGWAARLPESPRVCLSQGMCLFRPSSNIDAAFLLYVLNGSIGREQATRAAVGAAHPHINLGDIKSYRIPLPPIEAQHQIIRQLDTLSTETQRLESIYQRKLAALDDLKKSLLHQAFTGQL